MKTVSALERYLESVRYGTRPRREPATPAQGPQRHAITISRQTGSGAHVVADELAARLQTQARPGSPPWTVFDRNLVDRVLEDHDLPDRLAEYMPEDRVSAIADSVDELFGVHPSAVTLVRRTAETILRLAELGNVVLIGRGANIITMKLDHAFHVRLVGSLERRIRYVQGHLHLGPRAAAEHVRKEDLGRKRYVKKYYDEDIDDPLLYHVVINTDQVPYVEAARMIAEAVLARPDASGTGAAGTEPTSAPPLG